MRSSAGWRRLKPGLQLGGSQSPSERPFGERGDLDPPEAADDLAGRLGTAQRVFGQQLVDQGNTVVVIEHNLDVIKAADWLIDLGPEGGDGGGYLIAEGRPEEVSRVAKSYTGQFLRKTLGG